MPDSYDALIVGGGPAGLAAALVLGRCLRRVLVCDGGQQRNLASHAIHALPGHEGRRPVEFLAAARRELKRYPSVRVRRTTVEGIARRGAAFAFDCADGSSGLAATVLLATGLVDELPDIPRIGKFYGTSIHHCLYCDGFEYAGAPMLAYGAGDKSAGLALMMSHWSSDIAACCPDGPPGRKLRQRLAEKSIPVLRSPIVELVGAAGKLERVRFADGTSRACRSIFFSTGCSPGSALAEKLGCRRDKRGVVTIDSKTECTSEPGVYVAGDASRDVLLVAVAIGEGAKAAVAINRALLTQEGLL